EELAGEGALLVAELDHAQAGQRTRMRVGGRGGRLGGGRIGGHITPSSCSRAISDVLRPSSSPKTYSLCSPRQGAPRRTPQSVSDRCTGRPSTRSLPISRCSTSGHSPQALVFGSCSMRCSGVCTALAGTPAF